MIYTVIFKTIDNKPLVYGAPMVKGTELTEEIIKKYNIKDLRKLKIEDSCPIAIRKNVYYIGITNTNFVLNCPHFKNNDNVIVYVPSGFFSKYIYLKEEMVYSNFLNKILNRYDYIKLYPEIDNKQILEDWKNEGYPIFWNCKEEDLIDNNDETVEFNIEIIKYKTGKFEQDIKYIILDKNLKYKIIELADNGYLEDKVIKLVIDK